MTNRRFTVSFIYLCVGFALGYFIKSPQLINSDNQLNQHQLVQSNDGLMAAKQVTAEHADIEKLHAANDIPELQQHSKIKHLEYQVLMLKKELSVLTSQSHEKQGATRSPNTIDYSREQVLALMPEPFASTVLELDGDFAESFNQFQQVSTNAGAQQSITEDSEQWRYEMETRISDAVALHELALQLRIDSINCRLSGCEVRGFQEKSYIWSEVLRSLQTREWWVFHGSYSTSHADKVYGEYFYSLLNK